MIATHSHSQRPMPSDRAVRPLAKCLRAGRFVIAWSATYALCEMIAVLAAAGIAATSWPWIAAVALLEGTLLGLMQGWIVRGRNLNGILAWTLATISGVLFSRLAEFAADVSPLAASLFDGALALRIVAGIALGAVVGIASGSVQAIVLTNTYRPRYVWPLICGAAWATALPLLLLVGAAITRLSSAPPMLGIVAILSLFGLIGAIVGLIEGAGMALLRSPEPECSQRA